MEERSARNRQCRGSDHHKTKLTDDHVQSIRLYRTWGWSCKAIAARFDMSKSAIEHIIAGRSFSHVPYDAYHDGNYIPF